MSDINYPPAGQTHVDLPICLPALYTYPYASATEWHSISPKTITHDEARFRLHFMKTIQRTLNNTLSVLCTPHRDLSDEQREFKLVQGYHEKGYGCSKFILSYE